MVIENGRRVSADREVRQDVIVRSVDDRDLAQGPVGDVEVTVVRVEDRADRREAGPDVSGDLIRRAVDDREVSRVVVRGVDVPRDGVDRHRGGNAVGISPDRHTQRRHDPIGRRADHRDRVAASTDVEVPVHAVVHDVARVVLNGGNGGTRKGSIVDQVDRGNHALESGAAGVDMRAIPGTGRSRSGVGELRSPR